MNHADLYFQPHEGRPPLFGEGGRIAEEGPQASGTTLKYKQAEGSYAWCEDGFSQFIDDASAAALCFEAAFVWLADHSGATLLRYPGVFSAVVGDKSYMTVKHGPTHHHAIISACHAVLDQKEQTNVES